MFRTTRALALSLFIVLAASILLATIPVSAQTGDPALYDAAQYAKANGITLDEALRQLNQQKTLGERSHLLAVNEADTFGGFWIQHTPEYKTVVAFTTDPAVSRELVNAYFSESIAPEIEIRQVEFTYANLAEIRSQTIALLRSQGIGFSSGGIDVINNRVEIMVPDMSEFNKAISTRQLELHRSINIIEGTIELAIAKPYTNWVIYAATGGLISAVFTAAWLGLRKRDSSWRSTR